MSGDVSDRRTQGDATSTADVGRSYELSSGVINTRKVKKNHQRPCDNIKNYRQRAAKTFYRAWQTAQDSINKGEIE